MPPTEFRDRKIQYGRQVAILKMTLLKIYPYTQVLRYWSLWLIFMEGQTLHITKKLRHMCENNRGMLISITMTALSIAICKKDYRDIPPNDRDSLCLVFSNNRQSCRAEYCADGLGCAGSGELRCSRSRRTGRQACQVGLEGVSCSSCYNVGREGVPVTYGPMSYKVQ